MEGVLDMKFKKVANVFMFSKYVREDGEYTITSTDREVNGKWKCVFVVTNKDGEEIEVFGKLKDAKEAYKA